MKKLLLLLLLFSSFLGVSQIRINPVPVGYPVKQATDLSVMVMPFNTDAKTCQLYYQLKIVIDSVGEVPKKETVLADGNLTLTEAEFDAWARDNVYIENLALSKLQLTRKTN